MKKCTKCREEKAKSEFSPKSGKCKICCNYAFREYYKKNKEAIYRKNKRWLYEKLKSDPAVKLKHYMRTRVRDFLKGKGVSKSMSALDLLGCSPTEFKLHIEKLFKPGMNWENYGKWHIDHIIPVSSANIVDMKEAKAVFHYSNCRPLWAMENFKKSNKMPHNS